MKTIFQSDLIAGKYLLLVKNDDGTLFVNIVQPVPNYTGITLSEDEAKRMKIVLEHHFRVPTN